MRRTISGAAGEESRGKTGFVTENRNQGSLADVMVAQPRAFAAHSKPSDEYGEPAESGRQQRLESQSSTGLWAAKERSWAWKSNERLESGRGIFARDTATALFFLANSTPTSLSTVMFWLGLACKPWLWLGFIWLWLQILQAKAKAMDGGLAWLGFGLSHGFNQTF
ncbi:hypothetical protein DFH06DRAFT_1425989 [Mycena polygramma]|nr:hypothetical protein DFH06DRAFT_1425989 [Mycena polygramma]